MRYITWLCVCALLALRVPCLGDSRPAVPSVEVIIGPAAPRLERFAATELCDYLAKLFGARAFPSRRMTDSAALVFLIGSAQTNPAVAEASAKRSLPALTDQGLLLKGVEYKGRPALLVCGGSPRATLWAVYELVERWGVRYLTDRDVLPDKMLELRLPDLNVVMEPISRIRAHPTIQDYAPSGESWGIADFRVLINQLAKLKFTRMNIYAFGYQPYLRLEHGGIRRSSGTLWYGYHYPLTPDMIGRELFEDAPEFWNPDLPLNGTQDQLLAAAERQVHNLIEYAHSRGMECDVFAPTTDFPPEFAPLLKQATASDQLTVRPDRNTPADDPNAVELAAAVLRATVNSYPEADRVAVAMPETRQWLGDYERAWQVLDGKYKISQVRSLADTLAAAANRKGSRRWPGQAGVDQVKADITALCFYDRLLNDKQLLKQTLRPDVRVVYLEPAEELYSLLDRVLPAGSELGIHPENQPEDFLPRAELLSALNTKAIPGFMHITLDDDAVGLMPQFRPSVLHKAVRELQRRGWSGFVARERFPGDHDAILAYLARAGWDAEATPDAVIADLVRAICGEESVADLTTALRELESATLNLARNGIGFSYYVPDMMMKFWTPQPAPGYLTDLQQQYTRALEAARSAQSKSGPQGRWYPDFWVGRLEFSLGYANAAAAMHRGATAERDGKLTEAQSEAQTAYEGVRAGVESYARVARNRTDLGAIAVMNEYALRPLQAKLTAIGDKIAKRQSLEKKMSTKIEMQPYEWKGFYAEMRARYACPHDAGLCVDLRAPWMSGDERLILRTSEIVGYDTGYLYDDHFPTQEQQGRGKSYKHIPFQMSTDKAPLEMSADCVVPDKGRFTWKLVAHEDYVDIELSVRNDLRETMKYVDWYFCPVAFEAGTAGDPTLERTFLFDGSKLRRLSELSGVGKGEEMFRVTGPRGSGGFIPPLHAGLTRSPVEAKAPIILIQNSEAAYTVALAFERAHSIFSSTGNRCFHADPFFGLEVEPGEERRVRGRLYLMKGTPEDVLARFQKEFPMAAQ